MKLTVYMIATAATLLGVTANAEQVEIATKHNLDGYLNNYCLDIAGGGKNINPENGLQVHTCYSYRGNLGDDQVFDTDNFAKGVLYMPAVDVCVEVASLEEGAKVGLASCSGGDLQNIELLSSGVISPKKAPELCFTASLATRQGRNGTSPHQIKDLTLEKCSEDKAIFQEWYTRSSME